MIINGNELKAEIGMKLTNGHTFGDIVRLSEFDSASNWHEITDEEAEALQNAETEYKMLGDLNG